MLGGAELFVFCVGDIQWQLQLHAGVDGFMPSSSFNALQPCLAPTKLSFAKQSKSSLKQLLKKLKTETDVLKHGVAKEDFDGAMCSNAIQGIMTDGGKLQLDGKLCGNLWIPIPFFLFIIIACFLLCPFFWRVNYTVIAKATQSLANRLFVEPLINLY